MVHMLAIEYKTPRQILIDVGARAKEARLRLNMSRETLSDRSGVPASSIKRFEGTGLISLTSLVDILIALDRVADLDCILSQSLIPSIQELNIKTRKRGRK